MESKRRQIIEAENYPFPVKPEVSGLGPCRDLDKKLHYEFPRLEYCKATMADGNIIIQDTELQSSLGIRKSVALAKELNLFTTRTIQVVSGAEATIKLLSSLRPYSKQLADFLVVYPLYAGIIVKDYIKKTTQKVPDYSQLGFLSNGIELPVKRLPNGRGQYSISVDKERLETEKKPKGVLVIDDVVASGNTAYAIQAEVKKVFGGDIPCYFATWLVVEPPSSTISKSGVPLSDKAFASYVVRGNMMSRPPINSLSCFLQEGRKAETVKREYYRKYVFDKEGFDTKLQEMKGGE